MANRKTRRNQKIKNEKRIVPVTDKESMSSNIKLISIVIAIILFFYFISYLATGSFKSNDNTNDDKNTPAVIQYDEILAGETFKMTPSTYYVMFVDSTATDAQIYNYFASNYASKHTDGYKIYKVDLHKGFNTPYIGETSNPNVTNIDELKVKGPTLIEIKNGTVASYVEGKDAIREALK